MWVSKVNARGRQYFYLSVYDNARKRKEKHVFSLGRRKQAVDQMREWLYSHNVPPYLEDLGCDMSKVKGWVRKLEEKELQAM
ncbi:hypothetical protein [Amphibacillus cookii]|uniref:hypothetical protein n=1 Tax=Amphibacillus cookii TaxID=767787 RepID=UPI00195D4751|nr:hypothetical protein [Amphibacillus cookii]MBM7543242.1 hypothetical protein [Amphibacillus cookii]